MHALRGSTYAAEAPKPGSRQLHVHVQRVRPIPEAAWRQSAASATGEAKNAPGLFDRSHLHLNTMYYRIARSIRIYTHYIHNTYVHVFVSSLLFSCFRGVREVLILFIF